MKNFILAITTYNRYEYLKECIYTWEITRNATASWQLVIADDGSNDGTLEYLDSLIIEKAEIIVIKNKRFGVNQQMNTILNYLESIDYDFCFKIDDDLTFLKQGWDDLYYQTAIDTGNHHLVFCDQNWCAEQLVDTPKMEGDLIGKVPMLHAHGLFYTFTPQVIKKVGFMDVESFGFRGMGHVDFTMRCAKAGYTSKDMPWDLLNSNEYISATKNNYKSVLPSTPIHVYDEYNRAKKERVILQENRIYVSNKPIEANLYTNFKEELIEALSNKVVNFESNKKEIVSWYDTEILKIKNWYINQYDHLPKWYIKLGKIFKLLK